MQKPQNNELPGQRLSLVMEHLAELCHHKDLTLGVLLRELSVYGHMLVCLIFSVPFLLPVPLPASHSAAACQCPPSDANACHYFY